MSHDGVKIYFSNAYNTWSSAASWTVSTRSTTAYYSQTWSSMWVAIFYTGQGNLTSHRLVTLLLYAGTDFSRAIWSVWCVALNSSKFWPGFM